MHEAPADARDPPWAPPLEARLSLLEGISQLVAKELLYCERIALLLRKCFPEWPFSELEID
jgi:hypothetical protein